MAASGRSGRGGGSGGRGSNSTSWKDRIMAGPPSTAPTATAKPKAADNKVRSARLTGAGVDSVSQRLVFASQVLIGHNVEARARDGTVYEGIFHAINVSKEGGLSVVLKMATMKKREEGKALDMKAIAVKPEPVLMIDGKDLVQIFAKGVKLDAAHVGPDQDDMGFGTDSAISRDRGGAGLVGRELQKWVPDAEGMALEDMSLGGPDMGDHNGGSWDQFATNQNMYGVKTTYDENLYTTKLDKVSSKISEKEAARIAREIERGLPSSTNRHVAEERGFVDDSGEMDEEDKYSSVIRDDGKPKKPQRPAWSIAGAGVDVIKGALGIKPEAEPSSAETEAKPEIEQTSTEEKEPVAAEKEAATEDTKPDKTEKVEESGKVESSNGEKGEEKKVKSTLNPNAKAFTFNPNAKEFVPNFGGSSSSARVASSSSATSSGGSSGHGGGGSKGGGYGHGHRGAANWNQGGGGHHGGAGQMHMHGGPTMGGWMPHMGIPGAWTGGAAGYAGVSAGMMNMGGAATSQGIMGYGMPPRGFQVPGAFYPPGAMYPPGAYPGYPAMPMMVPGGNPGMGGTGGRPHGGGGGPHSSDST